jgi:hypothetical protein
MDSTTGGTLGVFGFLISAVGIVYTAINHKRLRCKCCGKDMDISVDVEPTTPPEEKEKDKDKEKEEEEQEIEIKPRGRRSSLSKTGAAGTGIEKYGRT